jgi:SAM-dependent methyltransferase
VSHDPLAGRSPALRAFVRESPLDRRHILEEVAAAAAALPPGARVLDAGAGDAPYRELFTHCDYVTTDWAASLHPGARQADVIAPIDALPLPDAGFDAVLCTQVLEHVRVPAAALRELRRVVRPGGRVWLTVPFVGELHEEPFDFFRYTPYGLRALGEEAGLEVLEVVPLGGYFTTLGQVARNAGLALGVTTRRRDVGHRVLAGALRGLAVPLATLDRLDRRRALPLGFACRARRPAED